ncbi:MAG: hypothetical protein ABMA64_01015 [Myxococcota bacterium]
MTLALIDATAAADRLSQHLGADPASHEGLCALLRAEVHARGHAPRSVTLDRVRRLVEPVVEIELERLASLCDALVREGDLVLAPGGALWATPLRAVPRVNGTARLFSSLAGPGLTKALGAAPDARGAARTVPWMEAMVTSVVAIGGRVLTPEAWAGLDRAEIADAAFLARLDERLAWEAAPPASLERDGPLEWRGWVPAGERPGWRRDTASARLWWARTPFRGHRRAWTSGEGSPATCPFVEVSFDDADRARFALSRQDGASPKIGVEKVGSHAILEIPAWLPRPEYRWLSLQAEAAGDAAQATRWRVPLDAVSAVTDLLAVRLGLVVEGR